MDRVLRVRLLGLIHQAEYELAEATTRIITAPAEVVAECITMAEGHLSEVQLLLHGQEVDPE